MIFLQYFSPRNGTLFVRPTRSTLPSDIGQEMRFTLATKTADRHFLPVLLAVLKITQVVQKQNGQKLFLSVHFSLTVDGVCSRPYQSRNTKNRSRRMPDSAQKRIGNMYILQFIFWPVCKYSLHVFVSHFFFYTRIMDGLTLVLFTFTFFPSI